MGFRGSFLFDKIGEWKGESILSVAIEIDNVVKKYGEHTVIQGLTARIAPGEFFTLLGPSGCGKTTLLRMIIGFNSIEGGEIRVDGRRINDVPVNKRNMGMVFQDYAVFPHMTVKANVGFGLKMQKTEKKEIHRRVDEILKTVKIEDLGDRMPAALSGGQRQRVALARAIVSQPEVLLMDEPLSNLDAKLRVEMRNAIKNIQKQIGITTVYVTHDQEEALAVSDRIAVMHGGVIQQVGSPREIYNRPANRFVATFIGQSNLLPGIIRKEKEGKVWVEFSDGYRVEMKNLMSKAEDGQRVCVSIRPEEFELKESSEPGIKAVIKNSVFLGATVHYFLTGPDGLELEVIQNSDKTEVIGEGTEVRLIPKAKKINVFTEDGEKSLIEGGKEH